MIIWIASYPKSGNTWVRSMIGSLLYTEDGIFNFKNLENIKQFPSIRYFNNLTSDYQSLNEIKKNWIIAQDKINLDNKIKFLKTHNANCTIGSHSFTNRSNTLATIYIVRDPRNIVTSLSNHYNFDLDYSKNFITSPRTIGNKATKDGKLYENSILTILGAWNDHLLSWTKNNKNLLIIRYEDLINNIEFETIRLIKFLNQYLDANFSQKKIMNCIESTSFNNLQNLEIEGNFEEGAIKKQDKGKNFFYLGKENKWENILDKDTRYFLEEKFKRELIKFKYLEN